VTARALAALRASVPDRVVCALLVPGRRDRNDVRVALARPEALRHDSVSGVHFLGERGSGRDVPPGPEPGVRGTEALCHRPSEARGGDTPGPRRVLRRAPASTRPRPARSSLRAKPGVTGVTPAQTRSVRGPKTRSAIRGEGVTPVTPSPRIVTTEPGHADSAGLRSPRYEGHRQRVHVSVAACCDALVALYEAVARVPTSDRPTVRSREHFRTVDSLPGTVSTPRPESPRWAKTRRLEPLHVVRIAE